VAAATFVSRIKYHSGSLQGVDYGRNMVPITGRFKTNRKNRKRAIIQTLF